MRSREPAPARATIILGYPAFGAVLGFILASVIALQFLGFERLLPNRSNGQSGNLRGHSLKGRSA